MFFLYCSVLLYSLFIIKNITITFITALNGLFMFLLFDIKSLLSLLISCLINVYLIPHLVFKLNF